MRLGQCNRAARHPLLGGLIRKAFAILYFLAFCAVEVLGGVDLVLSVLQVSPDPPHVGDKAVFSFCIENQGDTDAAVDNLVLTLLINDDPVYTSRDQVFISAGRKVAYSKAPGFWHWVPSAAGMSSYTLSVSANVDGSRIENTVSGEITVHPRIEQAAVEAELPTHRLYSQEEAIVRAKATIRAVTTIAQPPEPIAFKETMDAYHVTFPSMLDPGSDARNTVFIFKNGTPTFFRPGEVLEHREPFRSAIESMAESIADDQNDQSQPHRMKILREGKWSVYEF